MNRLFLAPSATLMATFFILGYLPFAKADTVVPTPMKLSITNVVTKPWNSGADAFGLWREQEGPVIGPAAVAYDKGRILLLDAVKSRILVFDKRGNALSNVAVPLTGPTDFVVDSATSSLLVVGQRRGELCKVKASGEVVHLPSVDMKWLVFPTKFAYETKSSTLFAQDAESPGQMVPILCSEAAITNKRQAVSAPVATADIQGQNLNVRLGTAAQTIAINMGRHVFCVEEVVTDGQGAVWALYTLEGDYRIRRLARVDFAKNTAGVAVTDVWFAFDATRHMAPMENGVVLFAGDTSEGRIVTVEYSENAAND